MRGDPTTPVRLAAVVLLLAAPVHAAFIRIEAPAASPGDTVSFEVVLDSEGGEVASLSADIGFEPPTPVRSENARPDCRIAPGVEKPNSAFVYRPFGCEVGVDCAALRAGITSLVPATSKLPIRDGTVFSCRVTVPLDAPIGERIELAVRRVLAVDPEDRDTDVTAQSTGDFIEVVERPACAGDCDVDGAVAIDELASAVAIALGRVARAACPGLSRDDGPRVDIDDVIAAVQNAGVGCPTAALPR